AFLQKTLHFMRRFLRDNGFDFLRSTFGTGLSNLLLSNRQPMSIGANQPQDRFLLRRDQSHQEPIKDIARVVVSGSKERLPNQLQETGSGKGNEGFPFDRGQRRR